MELVRYIPISLLMLLLFSVPFYFTTYSYALLAVSFASTFFVEIIKKRSFRVIWQEAALLCLLFFALFYYALSGSFIKNSISPVIIYYGAPFLMLFCIRRVWRSELEWLVLGGAYLFGCIVSALIVINNWQMGEGVYSFRYSINDLNSNYVSYSLAAGVAIALIFIKLSMNKIYRNCLLFSLALISFAVLLTGTRGAIISLFLMVVFSSYRLLRDNLVKSLSTIMAIVITIFVIASFVPDETYQRFLIGSNEDISTGRYDLWSLGFSLIAESPILGGGLGYFQSHSIDGIEAHNIFISVLVEFGIAGFLLYVPVLFSMLFIRAGGSLVISARLLFYIYLLPISITGVWQFSIALWFLYAWLIRIPFSISNK
jgi:O-antigen ligase